MKDEAGGRIIEAFVGLTAKLYSYKMFMNNKERELLEDKNCEPWRKSSKGDKKCKGVTKAVVKKKRTHEDYVECLFKGNLHIRKMNLISYLHEMFTKTVNKVALSGDDDKRFIKLDRVHTYAWGHDGIAAEKELIKKQKIY